MRGHDFRREREAETVVPRLAASREERLGGTRMNLGRDAVAIVGNFNVQDIRFTPCRDGDGGGA